MKHAFVTVVFEAEVDLLMLQARSMARFLPAEIANEIVVIDNSQKPMAMANVARLRHELGPLADRLRILPASSVATIPLTRGWRSQQVLKLSIAHHLDSPRYVVLDAKTHLVFPLTLDFLQAPDGRPTVNVYSYEDHPLRVALVQVLRYLNVDPKSHIGQFTATVPPFVLDTAIVREMIMGIESRSGRSFAEEFVLHELTEFFLYSSWIIASGRKLEDIYFFHQRFCSIVWGHLKSAEDCERLTAQARESGEPFFAIHRKAIAQFEDDQIAIVGAFWAERGLFPDVVTAAKYLKSLGEHLQEHNRFAAIRALPVKAVTMLRRVTQQNRHRSAN